MGTVWPFSIKQEGQAANFFEMAGSSNLASHQFHLGQQISFADFCVPVLNRIGRGLGIVPAIIAHAAAALPAFGHVGCWPDMSAPNKSNNLRAAQVGMLAALLTARNTK